jgi:S-adenosylmethionine:diacylglycerol 3-amino-3-carboxypropyl transferase
VVPVAEPQQGEALRRDYRIAFLRYLPRREETALTLAYDIGRSAVAEGTSVLVITQVHHQILREVVADSPADDVDHVIERAGEFLTEVLASVEMIQRSLRGV